VQKHPTEYVVLTGGEPLLAPKIEALSRELNQSGRHITIETAGTIFKPICCDLVSVSPKLANSTPWRRQRGKFALQHERQRLNLPVIQKFLANYDYQLKFVVTEKKDFDEIAEILEQLKTVERSRVLIMAEGRTTARLRARGRWIAELCKRYGYRFTPRLHIELYGNRRGT
jgi:7-carboxy-7-deazaguanine synthase